MMSPEAPSCQTCGSTDAVVDLNELGFGPGHELDAIHLCRSCIETRKAASWDKEDPDGQGILQALGERDDPPKERYTFVKDADDTVHLLRLRSDWVDDHATQE